MKVVSIVGARPQFIKASAVSRAILEYAQEHSGSPVSEILVHTGQHYDDNMSKIFFDELHIRRPDYNLCIGSGSHGLQTGRMLEAIEQVLLDETPDSVIVFGDTNSTLAGALAAAKLHIPVVHIEAGLRSFNRKMPEEVNRVLTDHVSHLLFCPTETAAGNLRKEGFSNIVNNGILIGAAGQIIGLEFPAVINAGDVMYDVSLYYRKMAREKSTILKQLLQAEKNFVLATVHRPENTDDPARLRGIIDGLLKISEDMPIVFPVHPRTREMLKRQGLECALKERQTITLTDPVSYLDMVCLEQAARVIVTDSGGVQKEAFFLGVPCITLREETEWVETVKNGINILAGADARNIFGSFMSAVKKSGPTNNDFYGDGTAAKKIVECLKHVTSA